MCLITKKSKQIAKENITCYKVVHLINNKIFSLYFDFKYSLNKLYKIQDMFTYGIGNHTCVEKAFHSYKSFKIAIENRDLRWDSFDYNCAIIECTIPKDAEYYASREAFASNRIIINKIICA